MKDFSWNYFFNTGKIDAYLLVKEFEAVVQLKKIDIVIEQEEEQ